MNLNTDNFKDHITENKKTMCWEWKHATTSKKPSRSYGTLFQRGKRWTAHRLSYRLFKKNPGKLSVCHKCDHPICCNPDHLFLGTQGDNQRDAYKKGRRKPLFGNRSILKIQQVRQIKKLIAKGEKQGEIGKKFGVLRSIISHIASGKSFYYVPNPTGFWSNRRKIGVSK